jgi:uncharacterized protein (TIGR02246 family)
MNVILTILGAIAWLAVTSPSFSEPMSDEATLRQIPAGFAQAWAKHDGHQLARIMADDVDFVTVGGTWLHGSQDFEKYHTRLLTGRFKSSTITPLDVSVRFLRPDIAFIRWSWTIEGDMNPDGSARTQRFGLMTMVAEKRNGAWVIVAAQNTNATTGIPPEATDIRSPITFPSKR